MLCYHSLMWILDRKALEHAMPHGNEIDLPPIVEDTCEVMQDLVPLLRVISHPRRYDSRSRHDFLSMSAFQLAELLSD